MDITDDDGGRAGAFVVNAPALLSPLVHVAGGGVSYQFGAGDDAGDGHAGCKQREPGQTHPKDVPGPGVREGPGPDTGCHG